MSDKEIILGFNDFADQHFMYVGGKLVLRDRYNDPQKVLEAAGVSFTKIDVTADDRIDEDEWSSGAPYKFPTDRGS